tara:strand:- start:163 stop:369 length:207 start_codon:yes stop_codon:yes gene_type:complete
MSRINIEVKEDFHNQLRIIAYQKDISMSALIKLAIQEHYKEEIANCDIWVLEDIRKEVSSPSSIIKKL